jgi:imidazole glycerol phosphate synthase subunit HisF
VASEYFRSGADKISIGSDAVEVAEKFVASGKADGTSSIEQISAVYGKQAVVVSIDPRRVYVSDPSMVGTPLRISTHTLTQTFPHLRSNGPLSLNPFHVLLHAACR